MGLNIKSIIATTKKVRVRVAPPPEESAAAASAAWGSDETVPPVVPIPSAHASDDEDAELTLKKLKEVREYDWSKARAEAKAAETKAAGAKPAGAKTLLGDAAGDAEPRFGQFFSGISGLNRRSINKHEFGALGDVAGASLEESAAKKPEKSAAKPKPAERVDRCAAALNAPECGAPLAELKSEDVWRAVGFVPLQRS